MFCQKAILGPKQFGLNNIGCKRILGSKIFGPKEIYGPSKILVKNKFGPKGLAGVGHDTSIWEVYFFGPKSILFLLKYAQIYFFVAIEDITTEFWAKLFLEKL